MKYYKLVKVTNSKGTHFQRRQLVGRNEKATEYLNNFKEKKQQKVKDYLNSKKEEKINRAKGLGTNNNPYVKEHQKPDYLGKINPNNQEEIQKQLNEFKTRRINSKVEHALVITSDGDIYECHGVEDSVYPDSDLGNKIYGSIISHNHPIGQTEYTFSKKDVEMLRTYKLKKLYGFDIKYSYEMELSKNPVVDNYDKVEEQYTTTNFCHNVLIYKLNQEGGISYRRRKNG